MLPFPKRKRAEEIELDDDDLVVIEDEAVEIDVRDLEVVQVRHVLPPVTAPPPKPASMRRLVARPSGVDRFEDDVADECLESIRAATSRARLSDSFPASIVPPAPRLPQFEVSDADETMRRPALTSSSSMPISRESVPGVAPAPSSFPPPYFAPSSTPAPVFARTSSAALPAVSSVAPVAMSSAPGPVEPTVIVVRQPPRTAWVVAAAFLGAACALFGMHLLSRHADPAPATASQAAAIAPPPPAATTAAPPASPAPPPPPATVRFNEDQAVAVVAPVAPPAAPAKPAVTVAAMKPAHPAAPPAASAPAKPASLGPKLPDGSMALGARAPEPTAPLRAPAPAPQPEAAPASAPKKKLTPAQELAEAQLKASMR